MFTGRFFQLLIIFIVIAVVGYAIFLEHYDHLLPCPLCVFQRIAYMVVALGAFIALIGNNYIIPRLIGWWLSLVFSLAGLAMALRQVWLQHLGPESATICVPGLNYLYNTFSWFKATMMVFQGTSDCATVTWRLWGLSMAGWSAVIFGVFTLMYVLCLLGNRKQNDDVVSDV